MKISNQIIRFSIGQIKGCYNNQYSNYTSVETISSGSADRSYQETEKRFRLTKFLSNSVYIKF